MLTIEFTEDGECIADLKVDEWWANQLDTINPTDDILYRVGTSAMIDAIRVSIYQKKLSHENVVFMFNDSLLDVDAEARIDHWPPGFRDTTDNHLTILLGWDKLT